MGHQNGAGRNNSQGFGKGPEELYKEVRRLIDSGSKREAIGGMRMLLSMYPDYALAHNDLGVLYFSRGEKEKALHHYEQAAGLEPENATYQKNLADFYCVEMGDLEEALKIYLKVLEANPTDIEALFALGNVCISLENMEDSKVFYNGVLELEPWNVEAQKKLDEIGKGEMSEVGSRGSAFGDQEADDTPVECAEGAGSTGQDGQKSEDRGRGRTGEGFGGAPEAVETAEDFYGRAQKLVEEGNEAEAIQELERLAERWPDYAIAHNDLGVLYYRQGDKQKTLTHYEQAARLEPENSIFQKNLADFYCVEMSELEKGLKIYLKVLGANQNDVEILLILGDICAAIEKDEDARFFYNRVLELEPWNLDAQKKLDALPGEGLAF
ncbi:MAG: tetratricopeptide repeat protein [Deltaproteobacteria bacterium]|nr:tetratricopeptide repeat protein [Deltaproteobacteria bacterium]